MLKQHFSHPHPLAAAKVVEDDGTICSGCEFPLSGAAYKCTKPKCEFHLHQLCFALPPEIHHPSHPKHPLILTGSPPYVDGEFACDGCDDVGSGFIYRCPRCQFDLHIHCAALPETLVGKNHDHPLRLVFESKGKGFCCGVCEEGFGRGGWVYYCGAQLRKEDKSALRSIVFD
ncbi:putative nucleoredoxin 1-1 [Cucumis melo var. makuwa]|uniref:Nucleoredoxin 1-1 n=1 Tax=Cucumis melo var. makuwa TaxID=1194695 RepID=A0A5A7UBP3_CUCMM|nr:putative nucleoredoxin 1-1 [Cucumis melo var. makuwa]TYK04164.1 putative nucleoredoxin 1-1 [Cucumis melo var. makuwa]